MVRLADMNISVSNSDALAHSCDVLALKYAQALYGLDQSVVRLLEPTTPAIHEELPLPSGFRVYDSPIAQGPRQFIFVGVPTLRNFLYDEMRDFASTVLSALASREPDIASVAMTVHGPGYGLDERSCFEALLGGLADSLSSRDYPRGLQEIVFLELNRGRAERLKKSLSTFLADELRYESSDQRRASGQRVARATVFVAMPFDDEFVDIYQYGIHDPLFSIGLQCERMDQVPFVGDVVDEIRRRIARSSLVVADLTGSNPNVYLEVGFAWASAKLAVLIARKGQKLLFDTQGQRCLFYRSANDLSGQLPPLVQGLAISREE